MANGVVYVGSAEYPDTNVYALNASTGAKLWSYYNTDGGISAPAVADGVAYFSSFKVYAFGLKKGQE